MAKIQGDESVVLSIRGAAGVKNSYGEITYAISRVIVNGVLISPGGNDIEHERLGASENIDFSIFFPRGYRSLSKENIQSVQVRGEEFVPVKTVREYVPRRNSRLRRQQVLFVKRVENFGGD